ncbi:hypothetical protein ACTM9K_13690 [Bariatricus sp. HCP3S3_E12]|uniref:hypothetical protein n=1 Tax=Bariatricus sp. HCP3S3_E12 TaxID=3438906 RepID=UPI003F89A833
MLLVFLVLVVIFIEDGIQQKRFEQVRIGYEKMETGKYEEAIQSFDIYLTGRTNVYWNLVEICNGVDSCYTYNNVLDAKEKCKEMKKIR